MYNYLKCAILIVKAYADLSCHSQLSDVVKQRYCMKNRVSLFLLILSANIFAQGAPMYKEATIPLKNVTLYSSGVAYYEHEGSASGSTSVDMTFTPQQINDVLKSLVVADSGAKSITVTYQSEDALQKILESLSVDVSSGTDLASLLNAQKGAEIEVSARETITGKILTVDRNNKEGSDGTISLAAQDGVHVIPLKEVRRFQFTDTKRNEDLNTALNLILNASSSTKKHLGINIEASGNRTVRFAYVMEAPVWKPTYRIDMSGNKAEFQAWAIIDNSTDIDWQNIKLTLTTGRPVGFKQDLYPPYYTYRPTLPLMVGQAAEVASYESDYEMVQEEAVAMAAPRVMMSKAATADAANGSNSWQERVGQNVTTSASTDDMFSFTPAKPVTINRQESVVIPIAVVNMNAEKFSVFSNMQLQKSVHPKLCLRIENKTDMKFPAGPISVSGEGTYAGDAVLEFLPAGETRLIGYGDDMEVSGSLTRETKRTVDTVKITGGILYITTKRVYDATYAVKNSAAKEKSVIIEHAIAGNRTLATTKELIEKTPSLYRFKITVNKNAGSTLLVSETELSESTVALSKMSSNDYISYSTNSEMPRAVRKAFEDIAARKAKVDEARAEHNTFIAEQKSLSEEQERVRKNLEAVNADTTQGRQFLDKLMNLENELDALKTKTAQSQTNLTKLENDFADYLKNVKVG